MLAFLLVATAAFGASLTSLGNGFAFDDRPIIEDNQTVRSLQAPHRYFAQPYWPPETNDGLYRPVTILGLALQWQFGGGSPLVFHLGNILLTLAATAAFLALARALVPPAAALAGALLFAVHPIHTEAVGNVVGQAELHATLGAILGALIYLRARQRGALDLRANVLLALTAAYGLLGKEQGLILPLTLAMLEVTVVQDDRPVSARVRSLLPTFLLLGVVGGVLWALRAQVLAGGLAGPIAWPWRGLPFGGRLLTMLGLVPEWLRLLVWPWHLRINYNPPAFPVAAGWAVSQTMGLVVLAGWAGLVGWSWRRARVVSAGLLWIAIALVPVSNVLIPTGVMLAERNLTQPSVGLALGVAGGVAWLLARLASRVALLRLAVIPGSVLIAMFGWRSADRMPVWRDDSSVLRQMLLDDPRSYYARFLQGLEHESAYRADSAEQDFRAAISLWSGDGRVLEHYAQMLWQQRRYGEAVPLLQRSLTIEENRPPARRMLYEGLRRLNRREDAHAVALRGIELGDPGFAPRVDPRTLRR